MKTVSRFALASLLAFSLAPTFAEATTVLDTGDLDPNAFPLALDSGDYAAAEFSLGAGQTITSIQSYVEAGPFGAAGDTFTISIYSNGAGNLPGAQLWSQQATYQQDGLTGFSNLNVSGLAAGNYWVALEVGFSDSTNGLVLGGAQNGSSPALGYAFSPDGRTYQTLTGANFDVKVSAVPVPGALVLFGTGLAGLGGIARKRRAVA